MSAYLPIRPKGSKKFIRMKEAAEFFGISPKTLYNWLNRGLLPPPKHFGPRFRGWDEATFYEALEKFEKPSASMRKRSK